MNELLLNLGRQLAILNRRLSRIERIEQPRPWQNWTPTVTQSGSVTVTINKARYAEVGGMVHLTAKLTVTGTGTAGNAITVGGIPINIDNSGSLYVIGTGMVYDSSVARYACSVIAQTGSTLTFNGYNESNLIGIDPSFALASGDIISFTVTYERA